MTTAAPTDASLVAESLRGDRLAFRQIIERYQAMACAIGFSILGDLDASEDLAQEAFLTAWQRLSTLHQPESLRGWLAGIVRNLAHTARRKQQRDIVGRAAPLAEELSTAQEASPVERAAHQEEIRLLWQVLEEVPEVYREPLVLYYREHQSLSEVAEAMGLSEDAVKQRLARGRQALKEQVAVFVENTLRRTGPKAAFTAGVLAALDGVAGPAAAGVAGAGTGLGGAASAATTGAVLGILGGIAGSLIGIAGGIFGTACSIRNARSAAERSLMIRYAWFIWIYCTILVAGYLYVAFWVRPWFESLWFQILFWIAHLVILFSSILYINRKIAQVHSSEHAPTGPSAPSR